MLLLMKKLSWSLIQSLNTKARTPAVSSRKKMIPRNTENCNTEIPSVLWTHTKTTVTANDLKWEDCLYWNAWGANVQIWARKSFLAVLQCNQRTPGWTSHRPPPRRARLGQNPPGLWWMRCSRGHPEREKSYEIVKNEGNALLIWTDTLMCF